MIMLPSSSLLIAILLITTSAISPNLVLAQDSSDNGGEEEEKIPPAQEMCNGIFIRYNFVSRKKEYPIVHNASAQAYAFKSTATVLNTMDHDLKAWKIFIGFQHEEILVSVSGAVIMDGTDFPAHVGNGTSLSGYPQADLLNAIDTAGDLDQIQAKIELTGTQFGVKDPGVPMPKTLKLMNDGMKCPAATMKGIDVDVTEISFLDNQKLRFELLIAASEMYVCCVLDPKFKPNKTDANRFLPRQHGDLNIFYDITQAYADHYFAQVTIDNNNPIGRLDNWNLTWEWMRGEFIYSMRGAYPLKRDYTGCIYGPAGNYYKDFDFGQALNCEKKPIIVDMPAEKEKDDRLGNIPHCCKNGTLLPPTMDSTKSKAVFQMQVFKLPPDNLNRTSISPPQHWKINGVVNPQYQCSPPIRVAPTEFPDADGLMMKTVAIATWQVVCNMTRPKRNRAKCCVSYSAFYNDSVVPCNTCACGCSNVVGCNPNAHAMLLPPEGLLIPSENRTAKLMAWAKIKHLRVPRPLPCRDNCGVSVNWHILSNYRTGWTARITLFNWGDYVFKDWSAAVTLDKTYRGFEKSYSFNGTSLAELKNKTIFFHGLPGLTYLMPEADGKNPEKDPRVPGKVQSVISFTKKRTPNAKIDKGDGFPSRLYFNGEECALPDSIPVSAAHRHSFNVELVVLMVSVVVLVLIVDSFS